MSTRCESFASRLFDLRGGLSSDARRLGKYVLLDTIGAILAGMDSVEATKVADIIGGNPGGSSRTLVDGVTRHPSHAALINGTAAHAYELDDFGGCGHSGAVVVPAALAAAELYDRSGEELITAIVIGYEAAARATYAVGGYARHNELGWHSTGTCGVFGAAAAVAVLADASRDQLAHALALAGSYCGGIWSFLPNGAMSKRLNAGKAAEAGVTAALLAVSGFTGPLHLFEDTWGGFLNLYAPDRSDPDALTADHGFSLISESGFKPYACCRGCHGSIDAILDIKREIALSDETIKKIDILGNRQTARKLGKKTVQSVIDAQMSLPFSVSVAIRYGEVDFARFRDDRLQDPEVLRLLPKIDVVAASEDTSAMNPSVVIHLKEGGEIRRRVDDAKGSPTNPMSEGELRRKFISLSRLALSEDESCKLMASIDDVENIEHASFILQASIKSAG